MLFRSNGPSPEATNVTVYYEPSSPKTAPPATTTVTPNPNPVNPSDSGLTPGGVSVLGTATVTEIEDSSLTLIDSGFVINTASPVLGYAVVSADFDNDGISDVAVGNRGYTDISGNVLSNGTIQVLLGGQAILNNSSDVALSTPTSADASAAVSGNTGEIGRAHV